MFRFFQNKGLTKLVSEICVGSIGGLYAGLIGMSLFLLFFAGSNYQALDILIFYAYAMIAGTLLGGLIRYLCCRK